METRSTQSKVSPTGSSSRIFAARERIVPSSRSRFSGATIGLTTLRCLSCLGGSMAMNIGSRKSGRWLRSVMPPSVASEEKTWWLVSTAMMSLYLVTDQ